MAREPYPAAVVSNPMSRRSEIGLWIGLVVLAGLTGLAIAGVPELGAGSEPVRVATPPADTDPDDTDTGGLDGDPFGDDETVAPATSSTSTSSTTTTSTTTPELRDVSEVTVLVVNGTTVAGAARRLSDSLVDQGYNTLTPTSTRAYDTNQVWFTGDYGPEAAALAEQLDVFPENVMLMPDDADITIGSANVIVIVGPGLAEEA